MHTADNWTNVPARASTAGAEGSLDLELGLAPAPAAGASWLGRLLRSRSPRDEAEEQPRWLREAEQIVFASSDVASAARPPLAPAARSVVPTPPLCHVVVDIAEEEEPEWLREAGERVLRNTSPAVADGIRPHVGPHATQGSAADSRSEPWAAPQGTGGERRRRVSPPRQFSRVRAVFRARHAARASAEHTAAGIGSAAACSPADGSRRESGGDAPQLPGAARGASPPPRAVSSAPPRRDAAAARATAVTGEEQASLHLTQAAIAELRQALARLQQLGPQAGREEVARATEALRLAKGFVGAPALQGSQDPLPSATGLGSGLPPKVEEFPPKHALVQPKAVRLAAEDKSPTITSLDHRGKRSRARNEVDEAADNLEVTMPAYSARRLGINLDEHGRKVVSIRSFGKKAIAYKRGLRQGDIVRSINGITPNSLEHAEEILGRPSIFGGIHKFVVTRPGPRRPRLAPKLLVFVFFLMLAYAAYCLASSFSLFPSNGLVEREL